MSPARHWTRSRGWWRGALGQFPGGAGQWIGGATPTNLGSQQGARDLVEVSGAFTTHTAIQRLNVRAVHKDGSRWIKVVNVADFSVLQDWAAASGDRRMTCPPAPRPTTTPRS